MASLRASTGALAAALVSAGRTQRGPAFDGAAPRESPRRGAPAVLAPPVS